MAHKFCVLVLGRSGKTVKQLQCSRTTLIGATVVAAITLTVTLYGLFNYFALQRRLADNHKLEQQLAQQSEEVLQYQKQIQSFASQINEIKERIVQLNKFEKKIRVIANIDQPGHHDALFGVGGSTPEDLNPDIETSQQHIQLIKAMHNRAEELKEATAKQQDNFTSLLNQLEDRKNLLAHTPTIRPADGWVASTFGYRQSPFTGQREFHKGMDIANRLGTAIKATADGVVTYASEKGSLGMALIIDHGHGVTTRYGHLEKITCKPGERVHRGEVIAAMGNTGRSTGPHLHYEVRLNGVPVNPAKYILN